jgi:signal transduction histidine kinase
MAAPLNMPATHAPVNVLLVDDQPSRLLTYRAILEPLGERLVDAGSGAEALQRLMEDEYAVILLDVNMPGMDGFETASLIHDHPRFEKTPIIFVTAVNVSDLDRMRGYKLGAVDYVTVPVIPEILRSKVVVLGELHRKRRELELANERLAAANEALQAAQEREVNALNASLSQANAELAERNRELQVQVGDRMLAEAQLREQDRRKDEFLATLAHELRNPLAPLRNALSIRRISGDVHDPLQELMERQLDLMVRLIDDLLDVARVSRGKLNLKPGNTTLQEVLRTAIETSAPLLEAGGNPLQLRMPEAPMPLYADGHRLAQAFSNLLSNAAKYSDAGQPIEITVTGSDGDDRGVAIDIRDHGIGLTAEQTRGIFELFAQVDTAVDRARGGLGIGLTLARHLIEMHGGTIGVSSDGPGRGSTFRVRLPVTTAPAGAGSTDEAPSAAPGEPITCRALVLDDNQDAADTLKLLMQMLGHESRSLYDPYEVEAAVLAFDPDIVFLDIGMPGLSGYELARRLRQQAGGAERTLVAVTGWGQPEDRKRTEEAGFDHHLVKPPELDAIRTICAGITRARKA